MPLLFISFIEKTKVGKDTILVSMNVSSLYTNIPQEEGTKHTRSSTIITHRSQRTTLGKRLFQFNEENGVICQYFHGGNWNEINPTKRNQAKRMETLHWWLPLGLRQRRSRWFIKRANYYHPSIKFTAEISENQITFLGTTIFRGEKFAKPITRRPKPSNLRTSPRATHQA